MIQMKKEKMPIRCSLMIFKNLDNTSKTLWRNKFRSKMKCSKNSTMKEKYF
jgi:hypothetical protein